MWKFPWLDMSESFLCEGYKIKQSVGKLSEISTFMYPLYLELRASLMIDFKSAILCFVILILSEISPIIRNEIEMNIYILYIYITYLYHLARLERPTSRGEIEPSMHHHVPI